MLDVIMMTTDINHYRDKNQGSFQNPNRAGNVQLENATTDIKIHGPNCPVSFIVDLNSIPGALL